MVTVTSLTRGSLISIRIAELTTSRIAWAAFKTRRELMGMSELRIGNPMAAYDLLPAIV